MTIRQHGIVGVDNGLFGKPTSPFSKHALEEEEGGDPGAILDEKMAKRGTMLRELNDYNDDRIIGRLDGGQLLWGFPE